MPVDYPEFTPQDNLDLEAFEKWASGKDWKAVGCRKVCRTHPPRAYKPKDLTRIIKYTLKTETNKVVCEAIKNGLEKTKDKEGKLVNCSKELCNIEQPQTECSFDLIFNCIQEMIAKVGNEAVCEEISDYLSCKKDCGELPAKVDLLLQKLIELRKDPLFESISSTFGKLDAYDQGFWDQLFGLLGVNYDPTQDFDPNQPLVFDDQGNIVLGGGLSGTLIIAPTALGPIWLWRLFSLTKVLAEFLQIKQIIGNILNIFDPTIDTLKEIKTLLDQTCE